jgi:hypothetical protein
MKFLCKCGTVLADQLIPNPIAYRITSDVVLEKLGDQINADDLFDQSYLALQCDKCRRLWIAWKKHSGEWEEFAPIKPEGQKPVTSFSVT